MSRAKRATVDDTEDPLAPILEHEEEVEELAKRDDRWGAVARYFLAAANGETPDPADAERAGLPKLDGGDR